MQQIWTFYFHKVVRQHILGVVDNVVHCFVENLTDFLVVKEFWRLVKIWRNYRHRSVVRFFWDTVYTQDSTGQQREKTVYAGECQYSVWMWRLWTFLICVFTFHTHADELPHCCPHCGYIHFSTLLFSLLDFVVFYLDSKFWLNCMLWHGYSHIAGSMQLPRDIYIKWTVKFCSCRPTVWISLPSTL